MTHEEAIDVVARTLLRDVAQEISPESVEDIGEYDFERVYDHVHALIGPHVTGAEFREAYRVLSERGPVRTGGEE